MVENDLERGLAVAKVGDRRAGELYYEPGPRWTLYSTHVSREFEGLGVGSALVSEVVAAADAAGADIDSRCWFVTGWLKRHPNRPVPEQG